MSRVELAGEVKQGVCVIKRMTEHDLLEVVEIEHACGLSLWGWDAYQAELVRPETIMFIAQRLQRAHGRNGRLLSGFIAARLAADDLHVNNIGVRESDRGRGVGSALLGAATAQAVERGARRALLEVRAGNGSALALYRRYGFRVTGRRRNYYRDPLEDGLTMSVVFNLPA